MASFMLCVIISVVRRFSCTSWAESASTLAAVFGSSAAVCSSNKSSFGFCSVAIKSVSAWRWPPLSRPTLAVRRSSSPRPSGFKSCLYSSRSSRVMPVRRVRGWPRRLARARFSSICMVAAVPVIGS